MFYSDPIHKKMSETCQKLAFTHPIVVLKSGLKNNWMKKLDRVNRPLGRLCCQGRKHQQPIFTIKIFTASTCMIDFFCKSMAGSNFCDERKSALRLWLNDNAMFHKTSIEKK